MISSDKTLCLRGFVVGRRSGKVGAVSHIATHLQMLYTSPVEYPFPPVGIVGAADGKNRRAFFFLLLCFLFTTA